MSIVTDYTNNEAILSFTSETAFTLPSYNTRNPITVKNLSTPALTLTAFGSELIDGAATYVLTGLSSAKLVKGEAGWVVVEGSDSNYTVVAQGVGTVYSLTDTAAKIDLGTTDPVIVPAQKGTYLVMAQAQVTYTGATVAAETASFKVRRTNNTAADASAVVVIDLPVATTLTHTYGIVQIPPFIYTTTATDDSLEIFANVSAALGAGTIDIAAPGTKITAVRLY